MRNVAGMTRLAASRNPADTSEPHTPNLESPRPEADVDIF